MDAGADTTTTVRVTSEQGTVIFNDTLLTLAEFITAKKIEGKKDATESQLNSLEGVRRLLLGVDAAHAVSWLWPSANPRIPRDTEDERLAATNPLTRMLPILRRRARRRDTLLVAMRRWVRILS